MKHSQGTWRRSKRGWIVRTDEDRICRVFHHGDEDEIALGNLQLCQEAPHMYETLRLTWQSLAAYSHIRIVKEIVDTIGMTLALVERGRE